MPHLFKDDDYTPAYKLTGYLCGELHASTILITYRSRATLSIWASFAATAGATGDWAKEDA